MSGPSAADMAEREKSAERRLRTDEQPKIDADDPPREDERASSQRTTERLTETRVLPKIED